MMRMMTVIMLLNSDNGDDYNDSVDDLDGRHDACLSQACPRKSL